jgi:glycosyltransferase involved in cell wall biosynthesis
MRISIVTETFPPELNGVARTVQDYVQQLQQLGWSVQLICPKQKVPMPLDDAEEVRLVQGAPVPGYSGIQAGFARSKTLVDAFRQFRSEALYIATEGPLGWSAMRAARKAGLPVITGLHTRFDVYTKHYRLSALKPLAVSLLRRFHNQARHCVVPTQALRAELQDQGFRNVVQIPRAVDVARLRPDRRDPELRSRWGLRRDDLAIIHVGRIAAEKNLSLFASTVRAIQNRHPGARCIMVGEGPMRAELESRFPDWIFTGIKTGESLARHFASADLFVFPSQSETFGNVSLEAMASGVASVCFDHAAAHEHIADGTSGALVPVGQDGAFLERALALADNPALRARLGLNASEYARRLDPKKPILAMAELFRAACASSGSIPAGASRPGDAHEFGSALE